MNKYRFDLQHSTMAHFREKDHIIPAQSLEDAIRKFARKHELEFPAYWDAPSFETQMEMRFHNVYGEVQYLISWRAKA